MLNSLLQDGVSNNAGQLVIETVPVQGADCWANSLCAEAGSNVFYSFAGTFGVESVGRMRSILKHTW